MKLKIKWLFASTLKFLLRKFDLSYFFISLKSVKKYANQFFESKYQYVECNFFTHGCKRKLAINTLCRKSIFINYNLFLCVLIENLPDVGLVSYNLFKSAWIEASWRCLLYPRARKIEKKKLYTNSNIARFFL